MYSRAPTHHTRMPTINKRETHVRITSGRKRSPLRAAQRSRCACISGDRNRLTPAGVQYDNGALLTPWNGGGPAGAQNSNVYIKTLIRNSYTWARGRKRGARVRGVREAQNGLVYIKTLIRNAYARARGGNGEPGSGGSGRPKMAIFILRL